MLDEHLVSVSARVPMPPLTVAEAAEQTGLSTGAIVDLARTMVARPPVVAIANDDNPAIAALNVVLGAVGARGGIVSRSKHAERVESAEGGMDSARAVVIDGTVPWEFVPQTDAEVFRFAAWDGGAGKADWLLPAPGFLEELSDVPTAPTSAMETYAVAPILVKARAEVYSAAEFVGRMDAEASTGEKGVGEKNIVEKVNVEKIIHQRCEDLFVGRAGNVYGNSVGKESRAIAKFASVKEFEEQLWKGAVWVGESPRAEDLRCELKEWPASGNWAKSDDGASANWLVSWRAPVLPPLAEKLYRESTLRDVPVGRKA
jgi:hypothetical protein